MGRSGGERDTSTAWPCDPFLPVAQVPICDTGTLDPRDLPLPSAGELFWVEASSLGLRPGNRKDGVLSPRLHSGQQFLACSPVSPTSRKGQAA